MTFTLTINCDNAAFEEKPHYAELFFVAGPALDRAANALEAGETGGGNVRDSNGNTCGHWEITDD